jgi:hypothetical protein
VLYYALSTHNKKQRATKKIFFLTKKINLEKKPKKNHIYLFKDPCLACNFWLNISRLKKKKYMHPRRRVCGDIRKFMIQSLKTKQKKLVLFASLN